MWHVGQVNLYVPSRYNVFNASKVVQETSSVRHDVTNRIRLSQHSELLWIQVQIRKTRLRWIYSKHCETCETHSILDWTHARFECSNNVLWNIDFTYNVLSMSELDRKRTSKVKMIIFCVASLKDRTTSGLHARQSTKTYVCTYSINKFFSCTTCKLWMCVS